MPTAQQPPRLLHDLVDHAAARTPEALALTRRRESYSYAEVSGATGSFAGALVEVGAVRGDRVAIYLDKTTDFVSTAFGAGRIGAIFVPLNPVLKAAQVKHILNDCTVTVLVTSAPRLRSLVEVLGDCPSVRAIILSGDGEAPDDVPWPVHGWDVVTEATPPAQTNRPDTDVAAILYTSGSTGSPKGVVLSHRNMVSGAQSVAQYLGNHADDVLLAALPLSFDAGFSQLTTGFHAGARVVLLDYLLPRDIPRALEREGVTGLTGVPTLWNQLVEQEISDDVRSRLRYIANTGGHVPRELLGRVRDLLPETDVFLMYGLTEAFRATYLPPHLIDARPNSMGKAIPNAEVLVLRPDGSPCDPDEPGELVQRGALVAQGYWGDPERTAERFRALPDAAGVRPAEVVPEERVVFSGDVVRRDADGFLYFVGRRDEMLKTSGYRVSPTEIEEIVHASGIVAECAAIGLPDAHLGHRILVVLRPSDPGTFDEAALLAHCKREMPNYMVPERFEIRPEALPKNQNGKIDRPRLAAEVTTP